MTDITDRINNIQSIIIGTVILAIIVSAPQCAASSRNSSQETSTEAVKSKNPLITWKEFKKSLTLNNYPIPTNARTEYETVLRLAPQFGIETKPELAMFLAQVYWESAGLQHTKEIACASSGCPRNYRTGQEAKDKYYYGRGYIQLTWIDNYANCSLDLYDDMRLVERPDLVSDTPEAAWGCAFWYWHKYVHDIPEIGRNKFGFSTNAINGPLECDGPYSVKAFRRFVVYVKVLEAFGLAGDRLTPPPTQDGCYPMKTESGAPRYRLCRSIGFHRTATGMFHWCNDNCNSGDAGNCPRDMCACEGDEDDDDDEMGAKTNRSNIAAKDFTETQLTKSEMSEILTTTTASTTRKPKDIIETRNRIWNEK